MLRPLPIDPRCGEIVARARECGAVVVVAPPGTGKTTRAAPALCELGPVVLLQPRRVAARSIARRIAGERGLELGREVGYQVRFESCFGPETRLLVATEGILTARMRSDPLLGGFRVVVLDEFHERSLHADLALAMAREAARARGDLAVVVMSATLDPGPVAAWLGGAPVVEVDSPAHPVEIEHAPGLDPVEGVRRALGRPGGHVLCFLPGAAEIRRTAAALGAPGGAVVLPLHGSLSGEEQDRALAPSAGRKVVLATNLAETSLTIDGVTEVVDSGLVKVARHDPGRGVDRLDLERVSRDSAAQRAGRAGRTAPGRALRLWDPALALRPRREPEIEWVDLSRAALEILAWGGDPRRFAWFEAPRPERVEAALALLERLGAAAGGRITPAGARMAALPLHPRLAALVLAAGGDRRAADAAAILSEPDGAAGEAGTTTDCDLLGRIDRLDEAPWPVRRAAREIARLAGLERAGSDDETLRRALLAGWPDRVARRREPGSPRLQLASGHGAVLGPRSGVRDGEWLVALEVRHAERNGVEEAVVEMASRVEREWLVATAREVVHRLDAATGAVRAVECLRYDALVLAERPIPPDPVEAEALLAAALVRRGPGPGGERLLRRLTYAGLPFDLERAIARAVAGRTVLPELDLESGLDPRTRRDLDRLAPDDLEVPSGRRIRLDYRPDGTVALRVKLQELFGLADSPRLGVRGEPLLLELLSPAGRPVQTTRDLASFWRSGYAEVRRELRARYPRHPWPEDPLAARPTHRPKPRGQ